MSLLSPNSTKLMRDFEAAALRGLPVSINTIWNPQSCPANILPWLAWALHVTDSEGWSQAMTVQNKRDLLSASFMLHRRKGTAQSVKDALAAIGFGSQSRLIEGGIPRIADGTHFADGSLTARHASWAEYSIEADLGETTGLSASVIDSIRASCAEYAPVSRHLGDVTFNINTSDIVSAPSDTSSAQVQYAEFIDSILYARYDGSLLCDGSVLAGEEEDVIALSALMVNTDFQARYALCDGATQADGFSDCGATAPMAEDDVMPMWMVRIMRCNGALLCNGSVAANSGITVYLEVA